MKKPEELRRDAVNGEKARQLLEDPMIKEALDSMRQDVFTNFRQSHWSKPEEREELFKMIRAIDDFEKRFKDKINGGKKAQSLLEKLFNKGE